MAVWYKEHAEFSFVFTEVEGPVKHSEKDFNMEVFRQDPVYNLSFIYFSVQHVAFSFQ